MMTVLLSILLALHVAGLIAIPWSIGKERKPITAGSAAVQMTISLIVLVMIVIALVQR